MAWWPSMMQRHRVRGTGRCSLMLCPLLASGMCLFIALLSCSGSCVCQAKHFSVSFRQMRVRVCCSQVHEFAITLPRLLVCMTLSC